MVLWRELELSRYPNASTLAVACSCSRSTAMRTIEALRTDFGAPIEYDESNRGYRLTDASYTLPAKPVSFEELTASLLVTRIAEGLNDPSLTHHLQSLSVKLCAGRSDINRATRYVLDYVDTEPLSSETTGAISLLTMLQLCADNKQVSVQVPKGADSLKERTITGFAKKLVFRGANSFILLETTSGTSHLIPLRYLEQQPIEALPQSV